MKTTIISVLVIVAIGVTIWLGGFLSSKQTELQALPGIDQSLPYGSALPGDPLWSVSYYYEASRLGGRVFVPYTASIYFAGTPALDAIKKQVPVPNFLKDANYRICERCPIKVTLLRDTPQPEKDVPTPKENEIR